MADCHIKEANLPVLQTRRIYDLLWCVDQVAATGDCAAVYQLIDDIYREFDLRQLRLIASCCRCAYLIERCL